MITPRKLIALASGLVLFTGVGGASTRAAPSSLWSLDNLHAWSVAPFDAVQRTSEERAQMLQRLGIRRYAFSWRERHIPSFEAEIQAMKKHGIELIAWNFLGLEIDDAPARAALDAIRRNGAHPQLWITHSIVGRPRTLPDFAKLLPEMKVPATTEDLQKMPVAERKKIQEEMRKIRRRLHVESFTRTPEEQRARVAQEADRVKRFVAAASPLGCKVALYPHNGWFGIMENQVAIIERLREIGVPDVGIVYNFNHSRDEDHDDSKNFPAIWKMIQPYVVAVNITGIKFEGHPIYPTQGDSELEMMRVIQNSGWKGTVGIIAEMGGDAEVTLRNYHTGLKWLAAELTSPGSGGPRPFPPAH